jgi:hypothetical protein
MGVSRTDYVVVGWKLKKELVDHKDFDWDRMYDRASDEFIYDGMCGNYLVFGKLVCYSDEYEGFVFTELEPADLVLSDEELDELKGLFKEVTFGQELDTWVETSAEPKAFIFSHFS